MKRTVGQYTSAKWEIKSPSSCYEKFIPPNQSLESIGGRRTKKLKDEWSDGMSDIEGKAAMGSSERTWAGSEFQWGIGIGESEARDM